MNWRDLYTGMNWLDLQTRSRYCVNYLFGGGILHACTLDNDYCKIIYGDPCEAFTRLYPHLFQPVLSSTETSPSLKPSSLEEVEPDPVSTLSKTPNLCAFRAPSEATETASRLKICECGKGYTPRCNRQACCDECSARRRKEKQRGYLEESI